jgi:thiosulfate reductase cytochrome b subunit
MVRPAGHPWWVRLFHWANVLAVLVGVASGWRIFNAAPLFAWHFPKLLTLGGWLGGALLWHFAAMWLLAANGLVYLLANVAGGRLRRRFLPLSFVGVRGDLAAALGGQLAHTDGPDGVPVYNAVQRLAYLGLWALEALIVASGLAVWKSVQFPLLRELFGGYEGARWVHFLAMTGIVTFVFVHLAMVVKVPQTLGAILWRRSPSR